jgi:plastocyanin
MEHHMANGMMTVIAYDGYKPTGPAAAYFESEATPTAGDHDHAMSGDTTPTATATSTAMETANAAEIAMVDDRFDPVSLSVSAGTAVTWVNKGRDWHSVAAFDGSFESGRIGPDERFSVRVDVPGVYQYLCKHHVLQGMIGELTVIQ